MALPAGVQSVVKALAYAVLLAGATYCGRKFDLEFHGATDEPASASKSAVIAWLGGFLACATVLALRTAWDVSRFLGRRAENYILQGEAPFAMSQVVKQAEHLLKQQRPLDAVKLLRGHLQAHPAADDVQCRIAEVYADQLKNPLAAALEYESLLDRKLDDEQWGWTAIRLARLYHKLRDFEKAELLLQRVAKEHPKTSAARKAEKLLAQW